MARAPRFGYKKTDRGWLVNVTATHSQSGRREQRYFPTREKALAFAGQLREKAIKHGGNAGLISPVLAEQATAAAELLKPFEVTLLEVVRRFVEAEQQSLSSVTVETAMKQFKLTKSDLSEKQRQAIKHVTAHLLADFPDRLLSTITLEELEAHIARNTTGNAAFNGKRRLLVTLWRWAERAPRGWCKAIVAEEIETRATVTQEIGILNEAQAKCLMATAERHFPDAVQGFAIALFTGMRQAELARLLPADVSSEGIRVPAASAKTKRRRFINMPSTLSAWLKAYPIRDSVLPPNWQRKESAVRRLAGWRVWTDLVDPASPPDDLPEWPDNALRHTHATVAIATGTTLEALMFEFGHSGGSEMLRSHYVGAIAKTEARKILQIGPNGTILPKQTQCDT